MKSEAQECKRIHRKKKTKKKSHPEDHSSTFLHRVECFNVYHRELVLYLLEIHAKLYK
jgi:hypothetical protein